MASLQDLQAIYSQLSPEDQAMVDQYIQQQYGGMGAGGAQPQQPSPQDQLMGAAGQGLAGGVVGGAVKPGISALGEAMMPGAAAQAAGAAPAAPQLLGAAGGGAPAAGAAGAAGAVPAAPELVSATAAPAGAGGIAEALSGALPTAGMLGIGALWGGSLLDHGKPVLEGKGEGDDIVKLAGLSNPITAPFVFAADALGLGIKSGKGKDQRRRDAVRKRMQDVNMINDDFVLELSTPEGGTFGFDVGRESMGEEFGDRKTYNIDWEQPGVGEIAGGVNPLAAVLSGGDEKLTSDFAGMFTNAITQGGLDPNQATRELYDKAGLSWGDAKHSVAQQWQDGKIDEDTRDAYFAAIDATFGVENTTGGRWTPEAGGFA